MKRDSSIPDEITREHILAAITDFDQGVDHRFGHSTTYDLLHEGERYPPKAIVGLAAAYILGKPLQPEDFGGGLETKCFRVLKDNGFKIVEKEENPQRSSTKPNEKLAADLPFIKGQIYHRKTEIHKFGGNGRSGIAPSSLCPVVFIFSGDSGKEFGYIDRWTEHGYFEYTGEGPKGDQKFIRGNRAIRDHGLEGRDLLVFENLNKDGRYLFLGYFNCGGWQIRENQPDVDNNLRKTIVFQLFLNDGPAGDIDADESPPEKRTLEELRKRAYKAGLTPPKTSESNSARIYYQRSKDVRDYVLARAGGVCESCGQPAPFNKRNGQPYLESHHTLRRTDGGPDHPRFVGGICPTCHKEIHHGAGGKERNTALKERLRILELATEND